MVSTRYLVLRYNQLRAKLYSCGVREDASFTAADDAEMTRVYDELMGPRYDEIELVIPGAAINPRSDVKLRGAA